MTYSILACLVCSGPTGLGAGLMWGGALGYHPTLEQQRQPGSLLTRLVPWGACINHVSRPLPTAQKGLCLVVSSLPVLTVC